MKKGGKAQTSRFRGSRAKQDYTRIDLPFEKVVDIMLSTLPKKKAAQKKKSNK